MGGLLAVPVAVLLFVLVLAMMGRRWAPAYAAEAEFVEDPYDLVDDFDPLPYAPGPYELESALYEPEPPRYAPRPYEPASPSYETAPAPYEPPQPSTALAPRPYAARDADRYESPLDHRYGSLERQPSAVYDPYGTQTQARDAHAPSGRSSGELELFGSREVEVYERPDPEPEPEEPRGFPYGPYKHN